MPVRDTTPNALAIQVAIHRRQTPAQRLQSAMEMSDFTHELAVAGLKQRNPSASDTETKRLLANVLYVRANG